MVQCMELLSHHVVSAEERVFAALGRLIGRRPWTVVCLTGLLYLVPMPGVFLLEGDGNVLGLRMDTDFMTTFTLTDSEEYLAYKHATGLFPDARNVGVIEKSLNGKSVLSADVLRAALTLEAHIAAGVRGRHNELQVAFQDVCARSSANAPCRYVSAASAFLGTGRFAEAKLQQLAALEASGTSSAESRALWLLRGMPRAADRYLLPVFVGTGAVAAFPGGGASDAALAAWLLTGQVLTARFDLVDGAASKAFEVEAERYLVEEAKTADLSVSAITTSTIGRECTNIGITAIPLLLVAIVLMSLYVLLFLGAETRTGEDTQLLVVMVGVGIPGLSTLAGIGFVGFCGLKLNVLALMAPFLGLAVGVDAVFLVLTSVMSVKEEKDLSEVMARAVPRAGVAATTTTLTSVAAFAVAAVSTTNFPGFFLFALLLVLILTFNWVGMLTLLPACAVLNERRIAKGRRDVLVCLKRAQGDGTPRPGVLARLAAGRRCRGIIADRCAPLVEGSLGCQLVGAALWVGMLAFGIACTPSLDKGMPDTYFVIDSSPTNLYFDDAETAFGKAMGVDVNILFEAPKLGDRAFREALANYTDALQARGDAVAPPDCWLSHVAGTVPPQATAAQVAGGVRAFMGSAAGAAYGWDARLGANGEVEAARCHFFVWQPTEAAARAKQAAEIMALTKASGLPATAYQLSWPIHAARYREILDMTVTSAAYAGIAVAVCLAISLPLHLALLALLNVAAVVVVLFGYMAAVGITCNAISYTVVLMSIGFCVDYSCHVAHFSDHGVEPGLSWDLRMGHSLRECGFDVMQGCVTAFLGVALLGFNAALAFRIFAAMSLVITGLGGMFALWGLPSLIALLARALRGCKPPPSRAGAVGTQQDAPEAANDKESTGSGNSSIFCM